MGNCESFAGVMGSSNARGFHSISTNDPVFAELGLSVFTVDEFLEVMKKERRLYHSSANSPQSLLDEWVMAAHVFVGPTSPSILHWDQTARKHKLKEIRTYNVSNMSTSTPMLDGATGGTNSDIYNTIYMNWAMVTDNLPADNLNLLRKIYIQDIKSSESGCVTWSPSELYYNPEADGFSPAASGSASCIKTIRPEFKLFLYDGERKRVNSRRAVGAGRPVFAATPETVDGQRFGYGATQNASSPGYNNFASVEQGGDANPNNSVAAEMDVFFNPTTGKWEGGTRQLLARMITDLPSAELTEFTQADHQKYKQADNYTFGGRSYTGYYNEGWAVPMSVHKGNPHLFGPVLQNTRCTEGPEKRRLKVINRTPTDFTEGDIVMLTRLDNEWVAQEFRKTSTGQKFSFGVQGWSFLSFITNSDHYFKDARHYYEGVREATQGAAVGGGDNRQYGQVISPVGYESDFRDWYYGDIAKFTGYALPGSTGPTAFPAWQLTDENTSEVNPMRDIAAINLGFDDLAHMHSGGFQLPDVKSSDRGHFQITSFDFLAPHLGGVNKFGNVIGRTNIDYRPDGTTRPEGDQDKYYVFYPFFGPIFTDGYRGTTGGDVTLGNPQNAYANGRYAKAFMSDYAGGGGLAPTNFSEDKQNYGGPFSYTLPGAGGAPPTWKQIKGVTGTRLKLAKQMPADVMLNASPSGTNGRPLENLGFIQRYASMWGMSATGGSVQQMCAFFRRVNYTETTAGVQQLPGTIIPGDGFQLRWNWLGTTGPKATNTNYFASYYDKKPVNNQSITFMPLTAELVGSWDSYTAVENIGSPNRLTTYRATRNLHHASRNDIHIPKSPPTAAHPGGGTVGPYENYSFLDAMLMAQRCGGPTAASPNPFPELVWSHSTQSIGPAQSPNFTIPKNHFGHRPNWGNLSWGIPYDEYVYNPAENQNGVNLPWFGGTAVLPGNNQVADCVGVITAKCKVNISANAIAFTTDSYLGCNQAGTTTGGSTASSFYFFFGVGNFMSSGPTSGRTPQWGSLKDDIHSFGTTALHIRCFEQWPDDQTMFDPRYFAVKHFNPGLADDSLLSVHIDEVNGVPIVAQGGAVPPGDWKEGDAYIRDVDVMSYSTDFRIPTWGAWVESNGKLNTIDDNEVAARSGSAVVHKGTDFRPADEWRVNPVSRGMMVPFKCKKRTIGIAPFSAATIYPLHYVVTQAQSQANDTDYSSQINAGIHGHLVVGNNVPDTGFGFAVGDLIGTFGGHGDGVELRVKETMFNWVNGKAGAIKYDNADGMLAGLEFTTNEHGEQNIGYDFHHDDFADLSAAVFDPGGPVQIGIKSGGGQALKGYVRQGVVWDKVHINSGPKEVGVSQRVSLASNNGVGNQTGGTGKASGRSVGMFERTTQTEGIEQFDIFVHFHNDISHTLTGTGGVSNFDQHQNHIKLDISTR
jgi:hypothetical protein